MSGECWSDVFLKLGLVDLRSKIAGNGIVEANEDFRIGEFGQERHKRRLAKCGRGID